MKTKPSHVAILAGFAVFVALYPVVADAQYKCVIKGSTVYSDTPCSHDAASVRAPQDNVTEEQYLRKRIQNIRDSQRKAAIERGEAQQDEINAAQAAARRETADQAARSKQRRCDDLQRQIASNKRDLARYEDFAMANSHRQRQHELRDNEEMYRKECR